MTKPDVSCILTLIAFVISASDRSLFCDVVVKSFSCDSVNNASRILLSQVTVFPIGLLPAALRAAQTCKYLIYSEADFEVFRPAGATRCTDGGEIWHGGGDFGPLLHDKFHPHRCNDKGVGPQN